MRAVLCLAGGIASGKSTLAHELAERLPGSTIRAFGDVVRGRATQEGRDQDRATLQEIGTQLIAEGWPAFVDLLLVGYEPPADSILIIEGIRHVEAIEEIRRRFPTTPVRVVFMRLDAPTSEARLLARDGRVGGSDHAVEIEVWRTRGMADLTIDADRPLNETIPAVLDLLRERQEHG